MEYERCWETKKESIRRYDKTVETYDRLYQDEQKRKFEAALETIEVPESEYVLDVGCGTGLLIEAVTKWGKQIVGVDSSKGMIERANRKGRGSPACFICADADYLPFTSEVFDLVFSFTVLQNLPYPNKTVEESCRVAKIRSTMILTALKKSFTKQSFYCLFDKNKKRLVLIELLDETDVKDFIAVCKIL